MDPSGLGAAVTVAKSAEGMAVKGWWLRRASRDHRMAMIEELIDLRDVLKNAVWTIYLDPADLYVTHGEYDDFYAHFLHDRDLFLLRFQKAAYRVAVYFPWVVQRDPDTPHWVDLDYYVHCIQTNQQIDVQKLLS